MRVDSASLRGIIGIELFLSRRSLLSLFCTRKLKPENYLVFKTLRFQTEIRKRSAEDLRIDRNPKLSCDY
jgi:hypothetical protein